MGQNLMRLPDHDVRVRKCAEAIKKLGGPSNAARLLGQSSQSISQWEVVPGYICHDVARLAKMSIHELRPDVFGVRRKRTVMHKGGQHASAELDAASTTGATSEEMDGRGTSQGESHGARRRYGS
jgi:DNA-binding transcriptional regulator YdaS (Cro superfamily)